MLSEHLTKDVDRVQLTLGAQAYNMAPNFSEGGDFQAASVSDPAYVAEILSPEPAAYALAVTVFYTDGTSQSLSFLANVEQEGYTFETADGTTRRVGNASVTLFENGVVTWDGSPYDQYNPTTTGSDGAFAWYAPNQTYTVEAEKSGYENASSGTFSVSDNIVNPRISMTAVEVVPPLEVPTIGEAEQAIETVSEALQTIRENEQVQTAATVAVPAILATAAVSTAALALGFDLLPFLQYLFTAPFLFFGRRKRKGFGIVYNSISKQPLDLAIVRLFRLSEANVTGQQPVSRLVQSRVTDKGGRYYFLVQPGTYRLTATKAGFGFPSEYLKSEKTDGEYLDIYHGEVIKVTESNAIITANIPLDPSQVGAFHTPGRIKWMRRLRALQQLIAVAGVLVSLGVLIVRPSMFAAALVVIQVGIYFLARRLAAPKHPKNWGIVYDQATKRPLANVVVRIFEPKYNKVLETTVTDSKGRYSALLGPNEYFSVYEREGYETAEVRPIDLRQKKEPTELTVNVQMQEKKDV